MMNNSGLGLRLSINSGFWLFLTFVMCWLSRDWWTDWLFRRPRQSGAAVSSVRPRLAYLGRCSRAHAPPPSVSKSPLAELTSLCRMLPTTNRTQCSPEQVTVGLFYLVQFVPVWLNW